MNRLKEKKNENNNNRLIDQYFDQWIDFMKQYNNTKTLQWCGKECKEGWKSCKKMQRQLFFFWLNNISDLEPDDIAMKFGAKTFDKWQKNVWKHWMKTQKIFLDQCLDKIKEEEENNLTPEQAMTKLYDCWLDMLEECTKAMTRSNS